MHEYETLDPHALRVPSWDERVEQARKDLERFDDDPRVTVTWHDPGEFFDCRVCTVHVRPE